MRGPQFYARIDPATAQLGVPQWILGQCSVFRVERRTSGIFGFMDATPITLLVTLDMENLKLDLTSPSCKSWPSPK